MPSCKQRPLEAPRGCHEHNFSQDYSSWEGAVFDRAEYFAVIEMRNGRKYTSWKIFPWAVRYAKARQDACIYAVTESGRFNNLERVVWDAWETRWWESRSAASERDGSSGATRHRGSGIPQHTVQGQ
jgi:hypothetical protein